MNYIDARDIHPDFTTIPCQECDAGFHVHNSFAYNHDTWYCPECLPEEIREATESVLGHNVEVRL